MKLSDRDKKLLTIALCAVLIVCAYLFGFKKISEANETLDKEIESNKTLLTNLRSMASREKQYKEDTEYYTSEYNNILGKFDTGYSQEYSIVYVEKLEEANGTWVSQLGLGDTVRLYNFGNIVSSNPINQGASVYSSDYVGYGTTLTLAYECSYDNLLSLIDYINSYEFKCKIDSISCAYNKDKDTVSGTLLVTIYAITGSDRTFFDPVIQNPHGTENIFDSDVFEPGNNKDIENGDNIRTDYDYYIMLDSFKSDRDSVIIGPRSDSASTRLTKNSNEREKITITFSGKDGDYTVSYKIGDETYPATNYESGVAFNPGAMLSLYVFGADRSEEGDDVSGADATIVNDTDMTLYIKHIDDSKDPRFKIKEKYGKIEVYE